MGILDELEKASTKISHFQVLGELKELLMSGGVVLNEGDYVLQEDGSVLLGGKYTFIYNVGLRMVVQCPKCGVDELTVTIISIPSIKQQFETPMLRKGHVCMDI
jgi:hypothetical protein